MTRRTASPGAPRSAWAVLAALAAAGALSCFSDRPGATEPIDETACAVPGSAITQNHAVVFVRNFTFHPDTLRIRPGTTVTWVNCENPTIEAHTSTSDTEVWDSPLFAAGESYTRTFASAGSFPYFCRPHPTMRGVVLVQ